MDNTIREVCELIKKVAAELEAHKTPIAFTLVIGKSKEGKSTALQQANLQFIAVEQTKELEFYYNDKGIFLCINESWLDYYPTLSIFFKKVNHCHKNVAISGLILCVDSSTFMNIDAARLLEKCKEQVYLLNKVGQALHYPLKTAVLLTKLDSLAGFSDFFQTEHEAQQLLGFSVDFSTERNKFLASYKQKFEWMIEVLGQQIISKIHPARSSSKRTLIREFPLQLASLRVPIQALIQNIPSNLFRINALYFSSAQQGGVSIDRLNKKIQSEYALTVQDTFPQSNNYRAFFINTAFCSFQQQTLALARTIKVQDQHTKLSLVAGFFVLLIVGFFGYQYLTTANLLDEASKELLTYESLISKTENNSAFYHLSLAENKLNAIPKTLFSTPEIALLKNNLHRNIQAQLKNNFLPQLIAQVEETLASAAEKPEARYHALKIYLMLNNGDHFNEKEITQWYKKSNRRKNPHNLDDKPLLVLQRALKQPFQPIAINQRLVVDVRNYLNALPTTYLFYSLAKNHFPKGKKILRFAGFDLINREVPFYFTKAGFQKTSTAIPAIASQLQQENWVLERQDLSNLQEKLQAAYAYEYVQWWNNFIHQTQPQHYQTLQQAQQLMLVLHQNNTIKQLIGFIQDNTSPDGSPMASLFNEQIASKFSQLSLLANSTAVELAQNILELERFVATLSLINDDHTTVFNFTKSRFEKASTADPLTILYTKTKQLPSPVSRWAKQIADDTWFILINETKHHINKLWQENIFKDYQNKIAERYPFDPYQQEEVSLNSFNSFFSPKGTLNSFVETYLKPFLNTSQPEWESKSQDGYLIPFTSTTLNELIRANVISNMFFQKASNKSTIQFSLQKINLDPIVAKFQLTLGNKLLSDTQESDSLTNFTWPESNARLHLKSIDNKNFELQEQGVWAFFKMLQKVNVLVDDKDSSSLQILFEINGNSGRYLLKTQNQINPFSPGILAGFSLNKEIC